MAEVQVNATCPKVTVVKEEEGNFTSTPKLLVATFNLKWIPIKIRNFLIDESGLLNEHFRVNAEVYLDECLKEWLHTVIGCIVLNNKGEPITEDVAFTVNSVSPLAGLTRNYLS